MIRTSLQTKTAATANLLTTAQGLTHLREESDGSTNDAYVDLLIEAAQQKVEEYTNRKLTEATFYFYLTDFPADGIVLPFSPIKSITSVKYYDPDNAQQTLVNNTDYFYHIYEEPCVIRPVDSWPDVYEDRFDAIVVEFVTGYTSPDECPEALKTSIKILLTDLYENRGDMIKERYTTWRLLADHYRVYHSTTENTT